MVGKQCAACGETNKAESNFCANCGSGEFEGPSDQLVRLTDEERLRIYKEENARKEAKARGNAKLAKSAEKRTVGRQLKTTGKRVLIGTAIVFVAIVAIGILAPEVDEDAPASTATAIVRPSIPRATPARTTITRGPSSSASSSDADPGLSACTQFLVIATRALQIDVSRLSAADIELAYEGITTDLAVVSIVSIKAEPDISDAFGRLYRAFEDRDYAATEGAIAAAERECRAEGYIP